MALRGPAPAGVTVEGGGAGVIPGAGAPLLTQRQPLSAPSTATPAACEGCEAVRPLRPYSIFGFLVDLCGACSRGGFETAVADCWRSFYSGMAPDVGTGPSPAPVPTSGVIAEGIFCLSSSGPSMPTQREGRPSRMKTAAR